MTGPQGLDPVELARGMADIGDALAAQLARLEASPDIDEAERVARNIDGAARICMRLREALRQEVAHDGHP